MRLEERISPKGKIIDKQMDKLRKEFEKQHLVMKKQKASMTKAKSAGRFVSSLQNPENWVTAFVSFIIYAMPKNSGKVKKTLIKLLSEDYSPNLWRNIEPIMESMMVELIPLMETMEGYDPLMTEFEPLVEEMVIILEEFEEDSVRGYTLRQLLEETDTELLEKVTKTTPTNTVGKGGKVLSAKDKLRIQFFDLLKKFKTKMLEFGISEDSDIERFLGKMILLTNRVSVKSKSKGKLDGN